MARYNSNGTLDTTFSDNGYALANFSSNWDRAHDAVLQPDGKIILIGSAEVNSPYDNFALARYNSDGSFDQSFGNGGKILMATYGVLSAAVLQSDAKMIALGGWHLKRRSRLAHKILRQHERAAGAVICLTSLPSFGVLYPRNTKRG